MTGPGIHNRPAVLLSMLRPAAVLLSPLLLTAVFLSLLRPAAVLLSPLLLTAVLLSLLMRCQLALA